MGTPEIQMIVTLLVVSGVLSMFGLVVMFWIARRLSRIEGQISRWDGRFEATESPPSVAETSPGGAFEAFLGENPERRGLTKSEQFAAYRQWRHEKGLNWST